MGCAYCGHPMAAHDEDSSERQSEAANIRIGNYRLTLSECLVCSEGCPRSVASGQMHQGTRLKRKLRKDKKPWKQPKQPQQT